jgi:ubiquinone/menaquinone biosynthesis C-methylase UbiE
MPNRASTERTRKQYKHRFFEEVMATAPAAVLEVGCGAGAFLKGATEHGQQAGIEAQIGRAEELPFKDRSFDIVVFQYVLHHCESLELSLAEAVRVARRGVLVLEAWYDESIASQRAALSFDRWSKTVDRRTGVVNNEFPNAANLLTCFPNLDAFFIDYSYHLILRPIQLDTVRAMGEAQLVKVDNDPLLRRELETILGEAKHVGLSDDGALFMAIRK